MKGVDYTKALSVEKEKMQNTIQKDRAYTDKRIKDEQALHSAAQVKQRDVYDRDRSRLEQSHQKSIENINQASMDRGEAEKSRFHENLEGERERFGRDRAKTSKDFDTRFRNIQESYQRNNESQEKQHAALQDNQQRRYSRNINEIVRDKDEKVKGFQDRMIGAGANLREEHGREKAMMARQQESRVEDLYKDESNKRFAMKEQLQGDLNRVRETQQKELNQLQEYNRDKVKNLSNNYNTSATKIAGDYSEKNEEIVKKQALSEHQRTKEFQNEKTEMRRGFDKDLRNATIESRRRDNGSGEFSEVAKRQQGKDEAQVYKDRVDHLQDALAEQRQIYADRRSVEADKNADMFVKQSVEAANNMEKQNRSLTADKIVNMTKEREKSTKLQTQQEATMLAERTRYEHLLLTGKNDSNKKITELKENFNESLKRLEENNEKYVKDTKTIADTEKRDFILNTSKQRNDEITDLRRNFNILMDKTNSNSEELLHKENEENKRLKDALDLKVGFERENAENKVQQQTELYNNKRAADSKSSTEDNDRREADFRRQMRDLSTSYQRKMDLMQYNAEIKDKHTNREYQNQLKTQAQAHAKELAEQKSMSDMEIKRLTQLRETEKAQITTQYENELTQAKQAHQEMVDRLDDYKRMG